MTVVSRMLPALVVHTRWLSLALLSFVSTACIADPHMRSGRVSWDRHPSDGVHVGGNVECGVGCRLERHDIITQIDRRPATDASVVHANLADGRRHTLEIYDASHGRTRTTCAKLAPEHLRLLGLATRDELERTPAHGRDRMWGFSVYATVLYDPPPAPDPFGARAGMPVFGLLMTEAVDHQQLIELLADELERGEPSYSVLVFRVFLAPEWVSWSPDELRLARDHPGTVALVPLLASTAGRHKRGTPWPLIFHVAPGFVVLDCNLLVRWHEDALTGAFVQPPIEFETGLRDALAFAAELGSSTNGCR